MLKKLLIFCLSFALFLSSCSCNPGEENNASGTGDYNIYEGINFDNILGHIVQNGTSEYSIVFPSSATQSEQYAASELQKYIAQASNVYLSLKDERLVTADSRFISVGRTALFAELGIEVSEEEYNGDGFVLKTHQNNLYICGANDRGTLYGIYDFLEKILGIKFLDIDAEYVPETDAVPLYEMDVKEIPAFKYRTTLSDSTYHVADKAFAVKMRYNHDFIDLSGQYGGNINVNKDINNVHNNLTYVSPSQYYSTEEQKSQNAHMFFLDISTGNPIDICYSDGINEDGSIDYSSLNAASAYIEGMKYYLTQNPNAEYYVCGQEDIRTCCSCSNCTRLAEKYGTTSATILRFYNAIARDIQAWADTQSVFGGREIKIVIFSYYFSAEAPVVLDSDSGEYRAIDDSVIAEDNIVIRFADIIAHPYYSFLDERNTENGYGPDYLEKWKPIIGDNGIWYWTYITNHTYYFGYYPYMSKIREGLTALMDLNCEYVLLQHNTTEYNDWKAIMDCYIGSKLCWHPNRSVKELQEEFVRYYFGAAAEEIEALIIYLDEWYAYTITNVYPRIYYDMFNATYVPAAHWEKVMTMIENAQEDIRQAELSAEEQEAFLKRLERIKLMPLYSLMVCRDVYYADDALKFNQVARDFFALCSEFGVSQYGEHRYISELKSLYTFSG